MTEAEPSPTSTTSRTEGSPEPDGGVTPSRAVILAGGGGLRATPDSSIRNKCLFAVHDRSLIERQIEIIRDQLGIKDIVIVVGHLSEQIHEALGTGERLKVSIRYIEVDDVDAGPGKGLLQARRFLDEPVFLFLGDEYHHASRHDRLLKAIKSKPDAIFTYTKSIDPRQIQANYSIDVDSEGAVRSICEKPTALINDLCGCGTLYITPKVIDALAAAEPSRTTGRVELYEVVASFIEQGNVLGVDLGDDGYVNVNRLDDLHRARFTYRRRRFEEFKISVVVPAWNEAEGIGHVVRDFLAHGQVAEVLVMDNESEDGTAEAAEAAGGRVISGKYAGYGDAVHAGLDAASGDILVVTEADFTFRAADLPKLLEYLKDADAVIGTRTSPELIATGAAMKPSSRIANVLLAKYMETLWFWLDMRFTDIGCSYRAIWRDDWRDIGDKAIEKGPSFTVEMMIEIVRARKRCIEVPVSYHPRFGGASKHCETPADLAKTAHAMWWMITSRWGRVAGEKIEQLIKGDR